MFFADHDLDAGPLVYRRIVVKAGTAILTEAADADGAGGVNLTVLGSIVRQICQLREQGAEVMLVTSGAIAMGRAALGRQGPVSRDIRSRQVSAAVGQSRLMQIYHEQFALYGVTVAQALLTIGDLSNRQSYLNVRNTLQGLLEVGVVPLLNENDVVAVDEIGSVFGDNDRLSALVANLVDADLLLILTDIDGLYTADPTGRPIGDPHSQRVERIDQSIEAMAGRHLQPWARGGMPTKLEAARLVTTSGIPMIMAHGREDGIALFGRPGAIRDRDLSLRPLRRSLRRASGGCWGASRSAGEVVVDDGAVKALRGTDHRSLLPAGVRKARTENSVQRAIPSLSWTERSGHSIACGIANYSAEDIERIRGLQFRQDRGNPGLPLRSGSGTPEQPGAAVRVDLEAESTEAPRRTGTSGSSTTVGPFGRVAGRVHRRWPCEDAVFDDFC